MNRATIESDEPATPASVILVVDDSKKNIQVVGSLLSDAGYEIMPAISGKEAFDRLQGHLPDLILLDLMMPEMDGLEVCRHLKNDPRTQEIPVIFLTASNEMNHLIEAFSAGAVDYVTKPFNTAELLARVKTHLELKQAREALVNYSNRLQTLNREKSEFMGIAAHDLRNPLNNLMGCLDAMKGTHRMDPSTHQTLMNIMCQAVNHMLHLVESYLDVNAIESGEWKLNMVACDLREIADAVMDSFQTKAHAKHQALRLQQPNAPVWAEVDRECAFEVISNLVSNAVKYSQPGKDISVRLRIMEAWARFEVQDQGPGLTPKDKERLFTKFARLSAKPTGDEHSTGLGLSIVKKMVELMHGRVWCESEPGCGTTFVVEWPLLTTTDNPLVEDSSLGFCAQTPIGLAAGDDRGA